MLHLKKLGFFLLSCCVLLNAAADPGTYELAFGDFKKSYPIITPKGNPDVQIPYACDMNDNYDLNSEAAKLLAEKVKASGLIDTIDVVVVPGDKATMLASYFIQELKKIKPSLVLCIIRSTDKGGSVETVEYTSITSPAPKTLHLRQDQADFIKRKKLLLADDVISSGGTIRALGQLVAKVHGEILGYVTIATEGDDLKTFDGLPLFKLAHIPVFHQ